MKIKSTLTLLLSAFAVFSGTAMAASVFQLDFINTVPAGNIQPGWEAFTKSADANNKTVSYADYSGLATGNLSITTSGVQFARNINNGSAHIDLPGAALNAMYNDLILRNSAGTIDITVAGLKAGTYEFRTHHLTVGPSTSTGEPFTLLVQDSNNAAFGTNVGTFNMGKGDTTHFAPLATSFMVTSNGADPVIVRMDIPQPAGGGQGAWVGINGLEIIPEPSTALLGALGMLALLRRRR